MWACSRTHTEKRHFWILSMIMKLGASLGSKFLTRCCWRFVKCGFRRCWIDSSNRISYKKLVHSVYRMHILLSKFHVLCIYKLYQFWKEPPGNKRTAAKSQEYQRSSTSIWGGRLCAKLARYPAVKCQLASISIWPGWRLIGQRESYYS